MKNIFAVLVWSLTFQFAAAQITGPATVCANDTATYSIAAVPGATSYVWTVPPGATINSGQNTVNIKIKFGTTVGSVTVKPDNSSLVSLGITLLATPSVTATMSPASFICAGSPVTLNGSGALLYTWSDGVTNGSPFTLNKSFSIGDKVTYTNPSLSTVSPFMNVADLDGDHLEDVIFISDSIYVYRNISVPGDITPTFATKKGVLKAFTSSDVYFVVADMDNDGKQDIVLYDGVLNILRNTSVGSLISFSAKQISKYDFDNGRICIADLDNDHKPDIIWGGFIMSTGSEFKIRRNISVPGVLDSSSFDTAVSFFEGKFGQAANLNIGDMDNDGKPDVIIDNRVYLNKYTTGKIAKTSFPAYVSLSGLSSTTRGNLMLADLNNDGKEDLVSFNASTNALNVLINACSPNIVNMQSYSFSNSSILKSIYVYDLDGDGKKDIVGTNADSTISFFKNKVLKSGFNSSSIDTAGIKKIMGAAPTQLIVSDLNHSGGLFIIGRQNSKFSVVKNNTNVYTLTGVDVNGCSASVEHSITIKPLPAFISIIGKDTSVCTGSVTFATSNDAHLSYKWMKDTTVVSGATAYSYVASSTGIYRVIVADSNNCTDTSLGVSLQAQAMLSNNSISSSQSICPSTTPMPLTGTTVSGANGIYRYQWQKSVNSGSIWSNVDTTPTYAPSVLATETWYRRNVKSATCALTDTSNIVKIKMNPKPRAGFTIDRPKQCFTGNLFLFTDTSTIDSGTLTRSWNFGDGTTKLISPVSYSYATKQTYTVKLISVSGLGCIDSASKTIAFPSVNSGVQPICLVTVDSTTQKNKLIWERVNKSAQSTYLIYKETISSGVYSLIGMSPADSLGLFIDTLSHPDVKADRYKISTLDTCGNESLKSDGHKTMHLTVNSGTGGAWNLIWESYEGKQVSTVNIYRGSSLGAMSLLAAVQGSITTYSDLAPPSGLLYYMTSMDFGVSCDPSRLLKKSYTTTQSNIVSTTATGMQELAILDAIELFPNPVGETLNLRIPQGDDISVSIMDGVGRQVMRRTLSTANASLSLTSLTPGLYTVALQRGTSVVYKKFVRQ